MQYLQSLNDQLIGLERNMELDMTRNMSRDTRFQPQDVDFRRLIFLLYIFVHYYFFSEISSFLFLYEI